MPSASFSTTTPRSPDEVFAYLADLRNTPTWMSFVDVVELVSGEQPGEVGARFLVTHERKVFDDTVVDYRTTDAIPGELLVFAAKHPKLEGTDTYRLAPAAGGGTAITYEMEFAYTGLNKVNTPLGALLGKAATSGLDDDLAAALERA